MAALEMIKRHSRNITVVKGPAHLPSAQERFKGAVDVLMQENVDFQVINTILFLSWMRKNGQRSYLINILKRME